VRFRRTRSVRRPTEEHSALQAVAREVIADTRQQRAEARAEGIFMRD